MNKEITPNEIANAIRDLLEERDEFQERLKEQDKSLQSWFNNYHKLKNKYDKQQRVLYKLKKYIENDILDICEEVGIGKMVYDKLNELLEEIE